MKYYSSDIAEQWVLGCIHTGQGHSHLEAITSIIGLPCVAEGTFNRIERKIGSVVEDIARDSCTKWREEEKEIESQLGFGNELKGAYDTSWSKRGGGYNSLSGRGTIIGIDTGKCIDYGIRNKCCRICSIAERSKKEPSHHDCRKNFVGTAKAMEPSICEELFKKESYKVMVGDEDSSCEAPVRSQISPSIEKWSDKSHVLRTLGKKTLHRNRKLNFGANNDKLNCHVKDYILSCFAIALQQNKGNAPELQKTLKTIVPHAFCEHGDCGSWCGYAKDRKSYKHSNLPGGRNLIWEWSPLLLGRDFIALHDGRGCAKARPFRFYPKK